MIAKSFTRRVLSLSLGSIIIGGSTLYVWHLLSPDRRMERDPKHYYIDWRIRLYTSLPWNFVSSLVGSLARVEIPISLRRPIYGTFVRAYDCRMDEAKEEDLKHYKTFSAFFNRELKDGVRPISHGLLVSPADGTILHYGELVEGKVEYVKGNDYEVHEFLGPINVDTKAGNSLYKIVIYLAPGDYHNFHSPAVWRVHERVHFPGYMLSVRPSYIDWIPKLFLMNERVVLSGMWKHGYFSMSAVAATNVGDIVITGKSTKNRKVYETESYDVMDEHYDLRPGVKVGEFRLGSTIVLIFEAPSNTQFAIQAGDTVRYGQSLLVQKL